jgi:hypothetical protein
MTSTSSLDVLEIGNVDWEVPDFDFNDIFNSQIVVSDKGFDLSWSGIPDMFTAQPLSIEARLQTQEIDFLSRFSIPVTPTSYVRSLIQRPKTRSGSKIVNMILGTLKSFPQTIQRHNTLPPFIHPYFLSSTSEGNDLEIFNNCFSLVRLLSTDTPSNRKLFWKNVRMECERICVEVSISSKHNLVVRKAN